MPDGQVGEVVITTFNPVYPLIRFATGDLSAVLPGQSPCGRTNMRIKGWMGRADQTTKVKGMFVHPSQVAQVVARHPEILKARLEVESSENVDEMTLDVKSKPGDTVLPPSQRRSSLFASYEAKLMLPPGSCRRWQGDC